MDKRCFQLIYASQCSETLTEFDLIRILYQANAGNARVGVTGVLVHKLGQFIQVLEGDKSSVVQMFNKIEKDERHTSIVIVGIWSDGKRISESFMEYRNNNHCVGSKYNMFFRDSFDFASLKEHPSTARQFLRSIATPERHTKQESKYLKYKKIAMENIGIIDVMKQTLSSSQ